MHARAVLCARRVCDRGALSLTSWPSLPHTDSRKFLPKYLNVASKRLARGAITFQGERGRGHLR